MTTPDLRRTPPLPSLVLAACGSLTIYLVALLRFPLLAIYNQPLQNLDKLTHSNAWTGVVLCLTIALLFWGYALGALALLRTPQISRGTALLVVGAPLAFAALLLFTYPTTSLDIYDYLFRGRMAIHYHANNFVHVPADFPTDPLMASKPLRFVPWSRAVTAYGPLWEVLSGATAWFSGERPGPMPETIDPALRQLMIGYKLLGALGYVLCGGMIWGALGTIAPERRWFGLFLWLWNPLVLWESVAAAHNDAWMAATIVAALWSFTLFQRQPLEQFQGAIGSFVALTIGGLIKYFAFIFGPLLLVSALRKLPTWRSRIWLIIIGALLCGSMVAMAYAPFWVGFETLRNFSDRGTLFYASWLAALQAGLSSSGLVSKEAAQQTASALGNILLIIGVLWSIWRSWREPDQVIRHATELLLWFLLVASPWFQPWYLLWALALAALQPQRTRLVIAICLFSATAMITYVAQSFLLPALQWPGEGIAWNLLLTILISLPPVIALIGVLRLRHTEHNKRAAVKYS